MKELILASNNKHKVQEFKEMLEPIGFSIKSLEDIGFNEEIVENGSTFKENSYIKAKTIYDIYKLPVIADDSGLIVDIINAPGVYSHRYAGENATDKDNRDKLVSVLKGFKENDYSAHFTTALTYIDLNKTIQVEGYTEGFIRLYEKGENGFGYDSLFYSPLINMTLAEATPEVKNSISHRHNALVKLIEELK